VAACGFDLGNKNLYTLGANKWEMFYDFTEDEVTGKKNFHLMEPTEFKILEKPIQGMQQKPTLVFPYPQRYGGTIDDHITFENKEEGMKSFNIKTTSASQVEEYL
jgi:hypothetical protein